MRFPLYPKTHEELEEACPYCGAASPASQRARHGDGTFLLWDYRCQACGKTFTLTFEHPTTLILNDDDGRVHEFYVASVRLSDVFDGETEIPAAAVVEDDGIFVLFHGYGDHHSEDGYGCPAYFENKDGHPHGVFYTDIRREDPEEIYSFEHAAAGEREPEQNPAGLVHVVTRDGRFVASESPPFLEPGLAQVVQAGRLPGLSIVHTTQEPEDQ